MASDQIFITIGHVQNNYYSARREIGRFQERDVDGIIEHRRKQNYSFRIRFLENSDFLIKQLFLKRFCTKNQVCRRTFYLKT